MTVTSIDRNFKNFMVIWITNLKFFMTLSKIKHYYQNSKKIFAIQMVVISKFDLQNHYYENKLLTPSGGSFWNVDYDVLFFVFQGIIHLLTSKKTNESRCYQHLYGMRMINSLNQDIAWLHKDTTMFHVQKAMKQDSFDSEIPGGAGLMPALEGGDWRFELRIRYLPGDWAEAYEKDKITFMCYYNQVNNCFASIFRTQLVDFLEIKTQDTNIFYSILF